MGTLGFIGLGIIIANLIVTIIGFSRPAFYERYLFHIGPIRSKKQFERFLTSGFLHANWMHLIFNMLSLYFFSDMLEAKVGWYNFLIIYFASLLVGSLFSFFLHRNEPNYRAVGASGAVSGVIFASIALFPGLQIYMFFIPMPSWLFAILYTIYSIYGIRSARSKIGHDAHLGGGIAGMLAAIAMFPNALIDNYLPILLVLVPSSIFILVIIKWPHLLFLKNPVKAVVKPQQTKYQTIDDKYNARKVAEQSEIDRILDKVSEKGMHSLTKKERATLDAYSSK